MGQHVIVPLSFIGMLNNQSSPFIVFREKNQFNASMSPCLTVLDRNYFSPFTGFSVVLFVSEWYYPSISNTILSELLPVDHNYVI